MNESKMGKPDTLFREVDAAGPERTMKNKSENNLEKIKKENPDLFIIIDRKNMKYGISDDETEVSQKKDGGSEVIKLDKDKSRLFNTLLNREWKVKEQLKEKEDKEDVYPVILEHPEFEKGLVYYRKKGSSKLLHGDIGLTEPEKLIGADIIRAKYDIPEIE